MNPAPIARRSSGRYIGPPVTLGPDEIDSNVYRTVLQGDLPGVPGWWTLRVDDVVIAESDTAMDQEQAIVWAQQVMGEGVEFLNGLAVDPSSYWVANPQMPVQPLRTRTRRARP